MTARMSAHWWGAAAAIEERIRAHLPAGWRVTQGKDLAGILDQAQQVNTVHLVPLGTAAVLADPDLRGRAAKVTQRWAIVVAVAAAGDVTGQRQRDLAGPVIPAILSALMGWTPGEGWSPLELAAPPGADVATEAFAYYPFAVQLWAGLTGQRA